MAACFVEIFSLLIDFGDLLISLFYSFFISLQNEALLFERYFKIKFSKMKGEALQKLVLSKYDKGEPSTKIFEDLNGFVSSRTIRR